MPNKVTITDRTTDATSTYDPAKEPPKSGSERRLVRGRLYRGYRLINNGYYQPDRCVWWEAENIETGEADFRATTRRQLKAEIDSANAPAVATAPKDSD